MIWLASPVGGNRGRLPRDPPEDDRLRTYLTPWHIRGVHTLDATVSAMKIKRTNAPQKIFDNDSDFAPATLNELIATQVDDEPPPPRNPAEIAGEVALRHALEDFPELMIGVSHPMAICIEVPGPDWVAPVAAAWQAAFPSQDLQYCNADSGDYRWSGRPASGQWVQFLRDGKGRRDAKSEGNATVAATLAAGGSVLGISQAPERHLPADLLRVADVRLIMPPLDAGRLAEVVTLVAGAPPTELIDDRLATRCCPTDLALARRPGESPDQFVRRLRQLLDDKPGGATLTLSQLHGMDEARDWGLALARDLEDYRAGRLPWSAVDRGILLYGPPGTGKTTYAKGLAGSCQIPLISASLGQWQAAGHLGDLLKAMRATFDTARSAAPSILFIDEIDGFGDRASFRNDHKEYSLQVVNGFLELLDGITGREGVVVIGACNHPDRLDPAILRSGRLERQILVPLPDGDALARIFRFHLGTDIPDADLATIAKSALGGSGADVERWVRGARRRSRTDRREMTADDLIAEIRGRVRSVSPEHLRRCAIHEAGHALVLALYRPEMLIQATVRQTDDTGGGVAFDPSRGELNTRGDIDAMLRHSLAGRAAEEVLVGEISIGAGGDERSDLARATAIATMSMTAFGLDDEQPLIWRGAPSSANLNNLLTRDPRLAHKVARRLDQAYEEAVATIRENANATMRIAALLLERETVDAADIMGALSEPLQQPSDPAISQPIASNCGDATGEILCSRPDRHSP